MTCKNSLINFLFLGKIKNVNELMSITKIFIFPTRNEGLPNVIIEAMSSGCVIFSNLLVGITNYLLPNEFIVNNNSINSYVSKLSNAISNVFKFMSLLGFDVYAISKSLSSYILDL